MRRRPLIGALAALPVLSGLGRRTLAGNRPHIAVAGAGAFGGWTALHLLRAGARVTLVEAIEAGHYLASSGGESRVIRHAYQDRVYVDMAARALQLWGESEQRWERPLLHRSGVLFLGQDGQFLESAQAHMRAAGVEFERLDRQDIASRYPLIRSEDLEFGLLEPSAGYLSARLACMAVRDAFIAEGGAYRLARALPGRMSRGEMQGLALEDGSALIADRYVFACGPWLARLFPDLLGPWLRVTRQEVYFFRARDANRNAAHTVLPVWADVGERLWYGIPGEGLFKVADDTRGPEVDPDTQSRAPGAAGIASARQYLGHRFPRLGEVDLADSRVCQYTGTPDGHFIADWHPAAQNVFLLGGGSGHGFKHGPALGELAASWVLGAGPPEPLFSLARFGPA